MSTGSRQRSITAKDIDHSLVRQYNAKDSKVSDDALANFVQSHITGDLSEVPGIGPKTIEVSFSFCILKWLLLYTVGILFPIEY